MCAEANLETAGDRDPETEADQLGARNSEMGRASEGARPGDSEADRHTAGSAHVPPDTADGASGHHPPNLRQAVPGPTQWALVPLRGPRGSWGRGPPKA